MALPVPPLQHGGVASNHPAPHVDTLLNASRVIVREEIAAAIGYGTICQPILLSSSSVGK
jgi:hypothetical protein